MGDILHQRTLRGPAPTYQTAATSPAVFHSKSHVYLQRLIQTAAYDDNDDDDYDNHHNKTQWIIDDDIDADSDTQITKDPRDDFKPHTTAAINAGDQRAVTKMETVMGQTVPPLNKILTPTPGDATPTSSQPQMSCRISRFPFTHPCDIPELIYDQDDDEDVIPKDGPSPLPSGPATPSVVNDIFRPLTEIFDSPNLQLNLGPFPPTMAAAAPSDPQQARKMSVKTMGSDVTDGLGIIREEDDDDRNTDGVSMLSRTESSFIGPSGEHLSVEQFGRYGAGNRPFAPSISSSGSTGSGEWRVGNRHDSRKSASIFSRMRNRNTIHEEPLEKRSLTPYELSAPTPRQDYDEPMSPGMPPPTASSGRTVTTQNDTYTGSRFFGFGRVAWFPDNQPKKREGAVFGVDLSQSIKTAPMKIRVSHRGKSTSYRTYPLSIYKCCEFIKKQCAADPAKGNVFSSPGNAFNVSHLKDMFNQPPMYGEQFQFEDSEYTVYDAARLIILYLEELPKPIISSSVIRSWIQLARQEGAIEPPAPRVETGLDFWTEALNRLPTASRNLVKHLLTLFAEILIAKAGEVTEVDARHLASAVSRAMFHQETEPSVTFGRRTSVNGRSADSRKKANKKNAHPTLALAFLIRKRGEYANVLKKATGMGDPRAKVKDPEFLPSTKEMLDWKHKGE
ncbi:hypothetical protein QBC38DRAFT_268420 [Podospora fimiseda]|uniref:Rho-GAP domain-containing protein n=1 Tax=Podospora fimiseda TaxID=252190 RepID=A0AAN7H0S0_9PEZI|nr:hypothetical protein QBC38DRAFT_268420 [Podospora fimiseda]